MGTTNKDDCPWILDFLRFTSFQGPFGSRILGFSERGLAIGLSKIRKQEKATHTTRSMVQENTLSRRLKLSTLHEVIVQMKLRTRRQTSSKLVSCRGYAARSIARVAQNSSVKWRQNNGLCRHTYAGPSPSTQVLANMLNHGSNEFPTLNLGEQHLWHGFFLKDAILFSFHW